MNRSLQTILAAAVLLLGGATLYLYTKYQKSEANNATLETASRSTQEQYAQTINSIAEIQDSLNAIALGDKNMPFEATSLHNERQMGGPSGQEALERIGLLRASIQRNKERIERLENDLHHSKVRVGGLEKMLATLKKANAEKEAMVAALTAQVDTLHTQVGTLTTQVAEVQDTVRSRDVAIADRQRELATVYYVADSKTALTKAGIVEAKGGVLGLGKTLKPSGRANEGLFRTLNTDEESVIQLPSAKAQVLSAQPVSSYQLMQVNGRMELHILSPQEFRKVRQLVIVTT